MRHRYLGLLAAFALLAAACQSSGGGGDTTSTTQTVTSEAVTTTSTTSTTIPERTLADAKAATVSVEWWMDDGSGLAPTGAGGTGAIVGSDGLILTNAHVGAPTAPGLPNLYGLAATPDEPPDALVIGIVTEEDLPPDPRFLAEPVVVEGWLDLAVLQIVSDLDGGPVTGLDLPVMELGDSDALSGGDELTVLGFPGVGGDTLSTTRGIVSGFLADDKLDERRGWVKTDTPINPGNSGGAAIDESYLLVGVPTRGSDQIDQLRPINLAKPLIDDARAGLSYVRATGTVAPTGDESLTFTRWGLGLEESGACVIDPVGSYPTGVQYLLAEFAYEGFRDGEDVQWVWFADGDFWYEGRLDPASGWTLGESGECFWVPGYDYDDQPLPDGVYEVYVLAGAEPRVLADATVEVTAGGGGSTGSTVEAAGRVIDLDTGQPIAEAGVLLLEPGTDLGTWLDDPTADEVIAVGETGPEGEDFLFSTPLERGVPYPVVVVAEGYQTMADCCLQFDDDDGDQVLITFRLVRLG